MVGIIRIHRLRKFEDNSTGFVRFWAWAIWEDPGYLGVPVLVYKKCFDQPVFHSKDYLLKKNECFDLKIFFPNQTKGPIRFCPGFGLFLNGAGTCIV